MKRNHLYLRPWLIGDGFGKVIWFILNLVSLYIINAPIVALSILISTGELRKIKLRKFQKIMNNFSIKVLSSISTCACTPCIKSLRHQIKEALNTFSPVQTPMRTSQCMLKILPETKPVIASFLCKILKVWKFKIFVWDLKSVELYNLSNSDYYCIFWCTFS